VEVDTDPNSSGVSAKVAEVIHMGREIQAQLVLVDGQSLWVHLSREQFAHQPITPEQRVYVRPKRLQVFPREGRL